MTTKKPDKQYAITEDLLDLLCDHYETMVAKYHHTQRNLLALPPEEVKTNLAVAHGMGECLLQILKHIPKEQINGNHRRHLLWIQITGTECRGDQSTGGAEETTDSRSRSVTGKKTFFPPRDK